MNKLRFLAAIVSAGVASGAMANTYVGMFAGMQDITSDSNYARSFLPGVFFGYGSMMDNQIYLAGELGFSYASNIKNSFVTKAASVRTSRTFSLDFLPAAILSDSTMAFIRVGILNSYFTEQTVSKYGLTIGPGVEVMISPCWSMRLEYDYSEYRSFTGGGKPKADKFLLSAKYTFDV